MRLSVVGLGKLGCPLAACLAAAGHQVIGVDQNEQVASLINQGEAAILEPGLEQLLEQTGSRLRATTDIAEAVRETELTFILVPTPSKPSGAFSLKHVRAVVEEVGRALARKDSFHVVVITSTVMPGDTGGTIRPLLEYCSGKRCSEGFGLCYNPEFVALGSVIRDLRHPDFILIGESEARSGGELVKVHESLCSRPVPVVRTSWTSAELAKLAVNTFVTTKISFANLLAEICERLEEGDVDAVTTAIGHDSRIGSRYLKAALGYGGPCFPRDNAALVALATRLGISAPLPRATDQINRRQVERLLQRVHQHLPAGGTVGILGLTYKVDTNVTEQAQGLELAERLAAQGTAIAVYDPLALEAARRTLPGRVYFARSPGECAQQSDVLVICTPCAEFRSLEVELPRINEFRRPLVIDCWRLLNGKEISQVTGYLALGMFDDAIRTTSLSSAASRTPAPPVTLVKELP